MTDTSSALNPIITWFAEQNWTAFPFQHDVWNAYLRGESGLIHSPTGSGKTYAAWLGPVAVWLAAQPTPSPTAKAKQEASTRTRRKNAPPLQVLWITPLRALAADTAEALQVPIDDLGLNWTIETRTGDTSS